jgi:signal transduction histidine kinase
MTSHLNGIGLASKGVVKAHDLAYIDRYISRGRIALSLLALVSMYVDPVIGGGPFTIDARALAVLILHLVYAVAAYQFLTRGVVTARSAVIHAYAILDLLFATAVAVVTEGATSPSYVFFCFAIVAVSCREGLRPTLQVTAASMILYALSIRFLHENAGHLYVMRPAYLGIIGCIAGFFGQERLSLEARARDLETAAQRRNIARSLHDGHVQALAGANLRLEACRELLRRGRVDEALEELSGLQASVTREYDGVRTYIRSLAEVALAAVEPSSPPQEPVFRVRAEFTAGGVLAEQVLQIMLEGLRNTVRHGAAHSASLEVSGHPATIQIHLRDDGVGFPPLSHPPWSIASRVNDLGGSLKIEQSRAEGAHVDIELPGDRS